MNRNSFADKSNLHESTYRFSDGVKGRSLSLIADGMIEPFEAPFTNQAQENLYTLYCVSQIIVLARSVESRSVLSTAQDYIFTVNQFEIQDIIKAPDGMHAGDVVTSVRRGGELIDAKERLRDSYNDEQPYVPGQTYLLILRGMLPGSSTIYIGSPMISVRSDQLHADLRGSGFDVDALNSAKTYSQFRSDMLNASSLKACRKAAIH